MSAAGKSIAGKSTGTPAAAYAPTAPDGLQLVPNGSGGLTATWAAPVNDGGDAVQGYRLTYQREVPNASGGWKASGSVVTLHESATATTADLTGLVADDFYSVAVAVTTMAGTGPAATTSTPVSPTAELAPGAIALRTATTNAIASFRGGRLFWKAPVPNQVGSIAAGNVLIGSISSAAPNGVLVKVVSVSRDSKGDVTLSTVAARLTDAVTNMSVSQSNLLPASGSQLVPARAGVSVQRPHDGVSGAFAIDMELSSGNYSFDGSLTIDPEFDMSFNIHQGFAGIPDGVSASVSAALTGTLSGTVSVNGTIKWTVATLYLPAIVVPVGPVPLVLRPEVPIELQLKGEMSLSFSASMTVGAALSWSSSDPLSLDTQNLSTKPALVAGPVPGVGFSESVTATLAIEPDLSVYGVTSADIEVDLSLEATMNFEPPPGDPVFEIDPSIALKAGWDIDISLGPITFDRNLTVTLVTLNFPGFDLEKAPNAYVVITPANAAVRVGQSIQLSAKATDDSTSPITWTLANPVVGDSVSSSGVLKVAKPAGRLLYVIAFNGEGAIGRAVVDVAGAGSPPGDLLGTLTPAGAGASLTWKPPSSTGDAALTSYTVVTDPPTTTETLGATATSARVSGLQFGTLYQVSVFDTNAAELTSMPASIWLFTPARGSIASATTFAPLLPRDAASDPDLQIAASACSSAGLCVSVGSYETKEQTVRALIETVSGSGVSDQVAPIPKGTSSPASDLGAVACPRAASCEAFGYETSSTGLTSYFVDGLSKGAWTARALPVPNSAPYEIPPTFSNPQIACPKAGHCIALSVTCALYAIPKLLIETQSHNSWTASAASIPYEKHVGCAEDALDDLSCPTTTFCATVGTVLPLNRTFQEVFAGRRWKSTMTRSPVGDSAAAVNFVACRAARRCVAVGRVGNSTGTVPLLETLSGTAWSPSVAPLPSNASSGTTSPSATLSSVSCPSPTTCYAFGDYSVGPKDEAGVQWGLVETLIGSAWTPAGVGVPVNGAAWYEAPIAECRSAGSCVAVASYQTPDFDVLPLAESVFGTGVDLNPSVSTGPLRGSTSVSYSGIACSTAPSCLAVGQYTPKGSESSQSFLQVLPVIGA
jgi:hypothetical protein